MFEVIAFDWQDQQHSEALKGLMVQYSQNLLGFQGELPRAALERLVPGLQDLGTARIRLLTNAQGFQGFVIAILGYSTFMGARLMNVHDFFVRPDYQGRGGGRQLMAALEEVARGEGCAKMTLEVQENNRQARSLYEAIGYKGSFLSEEAGDQRFLTKFL